MSEIERKFRLRGVPAADLLGDGIHLRQGYILHRTTELRVRSLGGDEHVMTVKSSGSLHREEWEVPIPSWVFDALLIEAQGIVVTKKRFRLKEGERTLEVDVYENELAGLVILECEFESAAEAATFTLPSWASDAVEVTHDPAFKNKHLAMNGRRAPLATKVT